VVNEDILEKEISLARFIPYRPKKKKKKMEMTTSSNAQQFLFDFKQPASSSRIVRRIIVVALPSHSFCCRTAALPLRDLKVMINSTGNGIKIGYVDVVVASLL